MKRKVIILLLSIAFVLSTVLLAACSNSCTFEWDEYKAPANADDNGPQKMVLDPVPQGAASEPSIQIHYRRTKPDDYKNWGFWLWTKSGSVGSEDKPPYGWPLNYQDEWGGVALYAFSNLGLTDTSESLGLIAKKMDSSWTKDGGDRFWDLSASTVDANNYYHIYLTQGDGDLYKDPSDIQYGMSANFTSDKQIAITTKTPVKHVAVYEGGKVIGETDTDQTASIRCNLKKTPDFNKKYNVEVTFVSGDKVVSCDIDMSALFGTDAFNKVYYYDGELGAIYSAKKTEFKVWSPFSTKITLNIYQKGNGDETPQAYEMKLGKKGVWNTTVKGDLGGKYYTYTVYNSAYPNGAEIVDPYAKSAGLNGARGQIVDFSKTNPDGWNNVKPVAYDANELVVWETHVADVTSSSTWKGTEQYRKKFLGMIETGTTYTEGTTTVKTGFDHIKELGVNAVQLVPIFDQSNDEVNVKFNWGYNPLNYNVLEGAYSTDATDGYVRIKEFKQLVMAFNKENINIIMDVVYNHVSAAVGSNFDVLMPGYYYRYDARGEMANGSGCGNETASDHAMFRKFMIDSVKFWASEYKLGGFRFDLMGLHDIETMNKLAAELRKINPSIVVYGEPWMGGTSPLDADKQANQANGNSLVGVAQFNDQMRDALIKGGLNGKESVGWVTGGITTDVEKIVNGLKGIVDAGKTKIDDMYKTINYVTCHDNYTLYDRMIATGQFRLNRENDVLAIRRMAVLSNAVVMTSNGTSFMLAGEEFLRTKGGDDNSYESSYKVNELDYALKIANKDIFDNYKALVSFKRSFKAMGLTSNTAVADNYTVEKLSNGNALKITIRAADNKTYVIVHANESVKNTTVDLAGYTKVLATIDTELSANTKIQELQTIIAYK